MADEILKRDQNNEPVIGLVTDDAAKEIRMGRIDDSTKGLKVMIVGGVGAGDVVGPAGATDGHLAVFDGPTGKIIKDGGSVPIAGGDVVGPATNTADYIPQWNGANSKTLKDGLAVPAGGLAGLTALNLKAPLDSPTFTTKITGSYLTASEILGTNASKEVVSLSAATYPSLTELTYLKGVTSAVQTQLNGKQASGTYLTSANIEDSIVDGHTTIAPSGNAVFDALALKAPLASPTFTGTPVLPTGTTGVTQTASDNSTKLATTAYVDAGLAGVTYVIPDDVVKVATVSLSSADILAGYTTPKQLISDPGVGKAVIVETLVYSFTAGTQYIGGGAHQIRYSGDTVDLVNSGVTTARFSNASSFIYSVTPISSGTGIGVYCLSNKAVVWSNASGSYTTGTGTAKIFIKYRIITL